MRLFKTLDLLKKFLLFFLVVFLHKKIYCQDKLNISFGQVTVTDFNQTGQKINTEADAVVIADIGKTHYEGNRTGSFDMVYTRFIRVKILNKNGFRIANYEIGLYNDLKGNAESITELKGSTYNLENGIIQETKLELKSIYNEKYAATFSVRKFAMPALQAGSMYDVTYTIRSAFNEYLRSWDFQSNYPCMWSEYEVTIPAAYHYRMKIQGDKQFDVSTNKSVLENFSIERGAGIGKPLEIVYLSGYSAQLRWVKRNVPAIKKEPYVSSIKNYIDRVSFQFAYFQLNNKADREEDISSWKETIKKYLAHEDVGDLIESDNVWMDNEIKMIMAHASAKDQGARAIYYFIRDNFSCTSHMNSYAGSSLKDVYKKRSGSVAEINLLLTAMLRHIKIDAEPAILSTRENGFASQEYPLLDEYNYLICIIFDGDGKIMLDASWPRNPYGRLMNDCYNGGAMILRVSDPRFIPFSPDSLIEKKVTSVIIAGDDKNEISGSLTTTFGAERSYNIREEIRKTSKTDYLKTNLLKTGTGIDIIHENFDSLDNYEEPLVLHYDLDFKDLLKADLIYFKPVLGFSVTTNPFKASERIYPVEMPYKVDNVYLFTMDIPKGFQIDEIPKSTRIKLNEDDGIFEYIIQQNPDNIQMQMRLKINKTTFSTSEYNSLREFYSYVAKKESEQIIFKKIH